MNNITDNNQQIESYDLLRANDQEILTQDDPHTFNEAEMQIHRKYHLYLENRIEGVHEYINFQNETIKKLQTYAIELAGRIKDLETKLQEN